MSLAKNTEVHISSIVIQVLPASANKVAEYVEGVDGAEVHMVSPEGKLVVTLETETQQEVAARIDTFNQLDGVINSVLIYHQVEDATSLDEVVDADVSATA